jgi:ABC-type bacteriocin/lantibiotic exporter with double-glycine peptidase domain
MQVLNELNQSSPTKYIERKSNDLPVGEVVFENFNGYWSLTDFKEATLKKLNVHFRKGLFYGIAGKVGSGKSGILSVILG